VLTIENLRAKIEDKEILKGLNLDIKPGEVHAIMGPNGSGKSTLSNILSGKKGYEVNGNITFEGENLLDLETEERAHKGIFLAFQYPLEIPGSMLAYPRLRTICRCGPLRWERSAYGWRPVYNQPTLSRRRS